MHVNIVCKKRSPTGWALSYPYAIYSVAWSFNSPIIENHSFHPFDTPQWLSRWDDWWWQHVLLCSCFLLSKLCEEKAHERELQSFLLQLLLLPYLHTGRICFDLTYCPELNQISAKTHPRYVYASHSRQALCFTCAADITKISLNHHNGKQGSQRLMQFYDTNSCTNWILRMRWSG